MRRYVEQILKLYNYIDGLIMVNKDGIVEYFSTFRPDVNDLREKDVLGKHILDVYPTLTEETSSILRVLKDGKSIINEHQYLKTYKGQSIYAINSTLPVKNGDVIIGAVDVSRYLDPEIRREDIKLSLKENIPINKGNSLYSLDDIITNDSYMLAMKERIRKVSRTNSSVLIYGDTGTGKELVAQSIHTHSSRMRGPFISQNCAAIPSSLLEGILFGTVKGSYTGAENRKGLFELAHGGTLFLDEINSMEISVQAKLLKAIEEKKVLRVGGTSTIDVDVRVISAANENPTKAVKENRLREDLFFRLGVVQVNIPPLRKRKNDIKILTNYFIQKYNIKMKRNIIGISEDVEEIFSNYSWPGNVRELKNIIEGAFNLTSNNLIQKIDLPEYIFNNKIACPKQCEYNIGENSLPEMIKDFEKRVIIEAFKKGNTLTDTAKLLKISKQSLRYKMDKYNL